jgi:thiamine pyrophosphokinase
MKTELKFKIGDKICYYDTLDCFTGLIRGTGEVMNHNGNISKIYLIEGTQDNSKEIEWFEYSVKSVDEWGELLNTSHKKSVGAILV